MRVISNHWLNIELLDKSFFYYPLGERKKKRFLTLSTYKSKLQIDWAIKVSSVAAGLSDIDWELSTSKMARGCWQDLVSCWLVDGVFNTSPAIFASWAAHKMAAGFIKESKWKRARTITIETIVTVFVT